MAQTYGYVRVSTREQNEDRQLIAMRDFGIEEADIFLEKQSGKDFNRPAYRRMLKKTKPVDTLVIKSATGSEGTTMRFWSSGESLQRNGKLLLSYSTSLY